MKAYIATASRNLVPTMSELVSYMWAPGITFSYARTGEDMHDSVDIAIKWDKWVDNPGWLERQKNAGYEYIDFEWTHLDLVRSEVSPEFFRLCSAAQAHEVLTIEVSNRAIVMNRRAFARAVHLVSRRTKGLLYLPVGKQVLDADQYYERNRDLIDSEFSIAVEPD